MELLINGETIGFTLDQEKNLADVLDSLESWLANYQSVISLLVVDGVETAIDEPEALAKRPLETLGRIEVTTRSLMEIELENAEEVAVYLRRFLEQTAADPASVQVEDALGGIEWVLDCVKLSADLHGIDLQAFPTQAGTLGDLMAKLAEEAVTLQALPAAGRIAALESTYVPLVRILAGGVAAFYARLEKQINAGNDLAAAIAEIRATFLALTPRVETIAADLSTGKEAAAMESIKETASALESLLGILHRIESFWGVDYAAVVIEGRRMDEWMEHLARVGGEVIEAFDNKDTVLLGDLFEYELVEVVRAVPAYLDAIAALKPAEA